MSKGKLSRATWLILLDFMVPKVFARPADRIVFGMVEIIDVVDVGSNFWGEEFRIHRRFFCPGVASQPGEVSERKGFRGSGFAAPDLPFSRACGLTEARAFSAGMTFAMASVVVGAGGTPAALAATLDAVGLNEPGCANGAAVAVAGEFLLVSSSPNP